MQISKNLHAKQPSTDANKSFRTPRHAPWQTLGTVLFGISLFLSLTTSSAYAAHEQAGPTREVWQIVPPPEARTVVECEGNPDAASCFCVGDNACHSMLSSGMCVAETTTCEEENGSLTCSCDAERFNDSLIESVLTHLQAMRFETQ